VTNKTLRKSFVSTQDNKLPTLNPKRIGAKKLKVRYELIKEIVRPEAADKKIEITILFFNILCK